MTQIKTDSIEMTCSACPSQWDAKTTQGEYVYIRVRHGYFRLDVEGQTVFDGYPHDIDGVMSTSEMIEYVQQSGKIQFV